MIGLPKINKNLLPLKLTLFFYSAAAFAILPYLTIHMKDIGISDIDIALIYSILPFCVFIAPPIVGFFGDKLGNYTRVLQLNILICGVFHTLLLFVPHNSITIQYPRAEAKLVGSELNLVWDSCNSSQSFPLLQNRTKAELHLFNCSTSCTEQDACSLLAPYCSEPKPDGSIVLKGLVPNVQYFENGAANLKLEFQPASCTEDILPQVLELQAKCSIHCQIQTNIIGYCEYTEGEMRLTTNVTYFLLRVVATMALACCFIMLDAQTIQMCSIEEEAGNKGAYGRQVLYKTLAQAIISPLVGILMDKITEMTGSPNYLASFIICDIFLVFTIVCVCIIDKDIGLPKDSDTLQGLRLIFSNISCITFLVMMFVCGNMFGFVETFLFVYLKEDLSAPIYLLGLTITTGALVSIPFLYYSEYIVNKVGMVNVIIWALIMYGVRYVGYSFITCAWYAFPFEALEVFTIYMLQVASAKYIKVFAPPGSLATMTGLAGGAHYGFGKGVGGLVGGVLKDQFSSTALAFRYFGIAAFLFGVLYAVFHGVYGRKIDAKLQKERELEMEKIKLNMTPFLPIEKSVKTIK